jgi:hypothetical protein
MHIKSAVTVAPQKNKMTEINFSRNLELNGIKKEKLRYERSLPTTT